MRHRVETILLTSCALVVLRAGTTAGQTPAGLITGFEAAGSPSEVTNPTGYVTGTLQFQDNWDLGGAGRSPRVQTAAEISAELTAAGLNVGEPVHSGDQALLVAKMDTAVESSGYFVRDLFTGLDTETHVTVSFWARPLTSGLGADPAGTPAGNNKTIGERQGNTFVGVADNAEVRAAAVRFGVDTVGPNPYENVVQRHIDFASATAGSAVWVKSGLLWTADTWYNFRFELDYAAKNYDFYVNDVKVNGPAIPFYNVTSAAPQRFFVSRGTNQGGQIIDDVSITASTAPPIDPGDFNSDGTVDGLDFLEWQRDTTKDFAAWQASFGATAVAAGQPVPEPGSVALVMGLVAVGVRRRRMFGLASSR
jgi:hypothetical protein